MGCLHNHTPRFALSCLRLLRYFVGIDWASVQRGDTLSRGLQRSAYKWFDRYFSETKDPGDNRTLLTPTE